MNFELMEALRVIEREKGINFEVLLEALLPQAEQVPYERYEHGARLKAYIVEVRRTSKGPQIVVSRTHPGLILRLFQLEVPEIVEGVVEIKAIAREPGHRTKIAVAA